LIYMSISIMSASWLFLIFTIIFAIIYLLFMPSEERYCLQTYGKEYQEYMERTPRWIGAPKSKK
jgi:protein-S-isoprenylcysteine O-methyltransferase Ste14